MGKVAWKWSRVDDDKVIPTTSSSSSIHSMLKKVLDLQATQGEVMQSFMTTQVAHAQLLGHTCGRLGFFASWLPWGVTFVVSHITSHFYYFKVFRCPFHIGDNAISYDYLGCT